MGAITGVGLQQFIRCLFVLILFRWIKLPLVSTLTQLLIGKLEHLQLHSTAMIHQWLLLSLMLFVHQWEHSQLSLLTVPFSGIMQPISILQHRKVILLIISFVNDTPGIVMMATTAAVMQVQHVTQLDTANALTVSSFLVIRNVYLNQTR